MIKIRVHLTRPDPELFNIEPYFFAENINKKYNEMSRYYNGFYHDREENATYYDTALSFLELWYPEKNYRLKLASFDKEKEIAIFNAI